ncbi:hypothetical protein ES705_15341 [subsurface metagenome]
MSLGKMYPHPIASKVELLLISTIRPIYVFGFLNSLLKRLFLRRAAIRPIYVYAFFTPARTLKSVYVYAFLNSQRGCHDE